MLIGPVGLASVSSALRDAERQLGRPVNPSVYPLDEFARRAATGNHFIGSVVSSPKIYLKGGEHELGEAIERAARSEPSSHPVGVG